VVLLTFPRVEGQEERGVEVFATHVQLLGMTPPVNYRTRPIDARGWVRISPMPPPSSPRPSVLRVPRFLARATIGAISARALRGAAPAPRPPKPDLPVLAGVPQPQDIELGLADFEPNLVRSDEDAAHFSGVELVQACAKARMFQQPERGGVQ